MTSNYTYTISEHPSPENDYKTTYTVGRVNFENVFIPESSHQTQHDAALRMIQLNSGVMVPANITTDDGIREVLKDALGIMSRVKASLLSAHDYTRRRDDVMELARGIEQLRIILPKL